MANCSDCGKKHGFVAVIYEGGLCSACFRKQKDAVKSHHQELVDAAQQDDSGAVNEDFNIEESDPIERLSKINSIMITTETAVDFKILRRIDIVAASVYCPIDMDVSKFKDDLFFNLKRAAIKIGANAIIGVNVSIVQDLSAQIGPTSLNRHRAFAVGTAVVIEEKQQ